MASHVFVIEPTSAEGKIFSFLEKSSLGKKFHLEKLSSLPAARERLKAAAPHLSITLVIDPRALGDQPQAALQLLRFERRSTQIILLRGQEDMNLNLPSASSLRRTASLESLPRILGECIGMGPSQHYSLFLRKSVPYQENDVRAGVHEQGQEFAHFTPASFTEELAVHNRALPQATSLSPLHHSDQATHPSGGPHLTEEAVEQSATHRAGRAQSSAHSTAETDSEIIQFPARTGLSYAAMKKQLTTEFEYRFLTNLLEKYRGNVTLAAREAKVDRSNFLRLMRRHHLKAQPYRQAA